MVYNACSARVGYVLKFLHMYILFQQMLLQLEWTKSYDAFILAASLF